MLPEPRLTEYAVKQDLLVLGAELKAMIAEAKIDIIRWNIITMLGFAGTIAAIVKFL